MKKPAFTKNRGTESGSGRKQMILRIAIVVAAVAAIVIIAKFKGTGGTVDFTPLTEESKIYVVAMRGEKPTTGYDIAIDSMTLSSDKDGNDTLTVNVLFTDPQAGASLTQAQTYPYIAAETNLEELPDKIEMKIKYAD